MGYISNRLVMQQTRQWKTGVVLHSGHSAFVQMLCELFSSFSEREIILNIIMIFGIYKASFEGRYGMIGQEIVICVPFPGAELTVI